jgi:hypothetical protein
MNLAADVAHVSATPVVINSDEPQNLISSERDQKDQELRKILKRNYVKTYFFLDVK